MDIKEKKLSGENLEGASGGTSELKGKEMKTYPEWVKVLEKSVGSVILTKYNAGGPEAVYKYMCDTFGPFSTLTLMVPDQYRKV